MNGPPDTKFPATHVADWMYVAHWATGPVDVCEKHAKQLVAIGQAMGFVVAVTPGGTEAVCLNCVHEAAPPDTNELLRPSE